MLVLDALAGDAPQLIAILTTRTATLDMGGFAKGREYVVRAVRKRWPDAQYAYEVEYTTGYGPRSGGVRRPHWNWFWKGIPRHEWTVASWVIVTAWCRAVDAEPAGQYVDVIRNEVGLTKYITEHFMKASQRPPKGFRGQRFCASRGYFGTGVSVQTARARARESLRLKRELWKASQRGLDAHESELAAQEAIRLAARSVWVLTTDTGARLSPVGHDRSRLVTAMPASEWAWLFGLKSSGTGYPALERSEEDVQASDAGLRPVGKSVSLGRQESGRGGPRPSDPSADVRPGQLGGPLRLPGV